MVEALHRSAWSRSPCGQRQPLVPWKHFTEVHGAEVIDVAISNRAELKHFTEVHGAEVSTSLPLPVKAARSTSQKCMEQKISQNSHIRHPPEALHRSAWSRRLADTYINFTEVRGAEGGRWCLMDIKFTKHFTEVHRAEDRYAGRISPHLMKHFSNLSVQTPPALRLGEFFILPLDNYLLRL